MKDFDQKKWDKLFNLQDFFIGTSVDALDVHLLKKNYHSYASSIHNIAIHQIYTGLLLWRVGQSPKEAFFEALEGYAKLRQAVSDYTVQPSSLWEYRSVLMPYIAYLVDEDVTYGVNPEYEDYMAKTKENYMAEAKKDDPGATNYNLRTMQYFCDFFKSGDTGILSKLETELETLSSISGFQLFAATYRTYLDLLTCKDPNTVDALVQAAEKNYLKRKRDKQMDVNIYGGGPYNPYMVDFILGAILKKINWEGGSRHKWLWG